MIEFAKFNFRPCGRKGRRIRRRLDKKTEILSDTKFESVTERCNFYNKLFLMDNFLSDKKKPSIMEGERQGG